MGDQDDAALIVPERVFQPLHRFRVEMVGWLVQQQDIGRVQQQLAQRHPAPFAARERAHLGVAIGAAQRIHRLIDFRVQVP